MSNRQPKLTYIPYYIYIGWPPPKKKSFCKRIFKIFSTVNDFFSNYLINFAGKLKIYEQDHTIRQHLCESILV